MWLYETRGNTVVDAAAQYSYDAGYGAVVFGAAPACPS
jgi:hypothetical protein